MNINLDDNKESGFYLFIIWEKSRKKTDLVLGDIKKKFVIREIYDVIWSKKYAIDNLKRFYGSMATAQQKADMTGAGPFLLILVTDTNPKFRAEKTVLNDTNIINTNVYDAKMLYREWIDNEYAIHGSLSDKETNHDVTLLLRKNINELDKELPKKWDGSIKKLESELIGYDGWDDMKQLFSILNGTSNYVILRNFENFPEKISRDVDILAENLEIIPVINAEIDSPRTINTMSHTMFHIQIGLNVKIDNETISFDLRIVGDSYYDDKWSQDILKRRVLNPNGFYTPCKEDYFYTLLYHAIFHKGIISDRYNKRLVDLAAELEIKEISKDFFYDFKKSRDFLKKYMRRMGYHDTTSLQYKTFHYELFRLIRVSIFLLKNRGIKFFFEVAQHKIKIIFSKS